LGTFCPAWQRPFRSVSISRRGARRRAATPARRRRAAPRAPGAMRASLGAGCEILWAGEPGVARGAHKAAPSGPPGAPSRAARAHQAACAPRCLLLLAPQAALAQRRASLLEARHSVGWGVDCGPRRFSTWFATCEGSQVRRAAQVFENLIAPTGKPIRFRHSAAPPPPTPPSRTKWTRRVHHPVLIGHAASLTPY
jgi:hypothetical protein